MQYHASHAGRRWCVSKAEVRRRCQRTSASVCLGRGEQGAVPRTRQRCVDVKHHGRDDFGVHRRRACIGDVVAHADIAVKTREGVRERGGRDAPFELEKKLVVLRNEERSCTRQIAISFVDRWRVPNVNKTVPRAPRGPRGVNMSPVPVGWFEHADTDGDGKVSGGEAVAFFSRAGLPQASLAALWQLVDNPPRGFLEKSQFDVAVQLIYVAQQGGEMNEMQAIKRCKSY